MHLILSMIFTLSVANENLKYPSLTKPILGNRQWFTCKDIFYKQTHQSY